MAKKAATKPAAKKRPAKRKPVEPAIELSELSDDTKKRLAEILDAKKQSPAKSSSPWRRLLWSGGVVAGLAVSFVGGAWSAGGWQIGPGPAHADSVSAVYDALEAKFRSVNGECAGLLRAGELKSEKAAADWIQERLEEASQPIWVPLLQEEAKAFGGKDWTAEKQAAHIERYAR